MSARPMLLSTLALAGLFTGCTPPPPAPEAVRAVRTMTLAADSVGGTIEYAAEVRARTEVRLGFRVPGKMIARSAEVGQRVQAGQALARLDATDLRLAQDTAAAATRAAQANFDVVAAEFKRYRELRDQGFISALELERRSSALQAAQSQLEQARAQGAVQVNQAGYAALTAPGAGVVVGVDAEPGAVRAVGASVVRLALDGPRDAVFTVPEDSLATLRSLQGQAGAVKVRAWGTQTLLPATVREVAAAADPVTRTFLVKADLGATPLQLGQTLTVVMDLPRQPGVTRLPLSAVMQQQGQSAVWVLDRESMTVKAQPIQVAGADGNSLVVSSGLSAGQTVVTAGVHVLTTGQKVKLYEASAPASP